MTSLTKLIEPVEGEVGTRIEGLVAADEEVLIRVYSDLQEDGHFGRQWLVVTQKRALIVPAHRHGGVVEVPIAGMKAVQTERLVGGGRLEIECREAPTILLPYTNSQAPKFSEVARGLEQLRQGEPFLVNPELDRVRCEKCGRLLPEKNGLCPACVRKLVIIKRIASYLKPYKARTTLLALATVVTAGAELAPPMITKYLVDDVLAPEEGSAAPVGERLGLLGLLVLGLVGIRILSWGAEWVHGWIISWLGPQVTADVRSQLYRRLEMLSLQFYDKRKVGALMSRATRDAGMLQEFLVDGVPYLVINILMILGILGFLFWMSWGLSLYIVLPIPLIVIWGMVFWKRMRRFFNKWGQIWSDLTQRTNEALSGIRVVKAFAQEQREIAVFDKVNARLTDIGVKTGFNRGLFFATVSFLTGLGGVIVWLFGGREVLLGELTLGTLLAFYSYMWMVYGPLEWFGQVSSWMSRAFAGAERIFEVIDTAPEAYQDPQAVAVPRMRGQVRFRAVTFGYDKSKPVIRNMDLEVKPGEMIGLVGKSGVGKTTTVNLICRFYDVDHGAIEVDGVDLRQIRLEDLRGQIGIVLQEPFLFSGTISENIAYAKPGASFAEIMAAARVANAHPFIVAKPDGYDTPVGERGNKLSGGERQRVAIARAILHNPRILILDEATSSVDVETEKQIQDAIGELIRGRTTFAIAHRLSTLRNADRLVVLDEGRIVEVGTHAELMERQGAFYKLLQEQQQSAEIIALKE
jgi:ATP-binding cassette subfamily B protein